MAEKKITKREVIAKMLEDEHIKANPEFVAYLEHELELLNKKVEKKGKSDEEIAETNRLKKIVAETLAVIGKGTVTEIQKANEELGDLSNQKVSSLLKEMKEKDETVIKTIEGRKSVFSLA